MSGNDVHRPMPPQPKQEQVAPGLTQAMEPVPDPGGKSYTEAGRLKGKVAPLGRAGQPAEMAVAYVLPACDLGSHMTGAVIPVTGGEIMI